MNKTLLLSLAFSIVLNSSKAQNVNAPVYTITQNGGNNGGIFVRFNSNAVTRSNVWQVLTPALALGDADAMQLSKSSAQDQLGITTLRYTQMYKGVEVANAEFLLHEKAGIIVSANGSVVSGLNMDIQPGIAESVALYAALKNIGEVQYRWQDAQGNTVADTYYPHGKLVIAAGNVASTDPKSSSFMLAVYHCRKRFEQGLDGICRRTNRGCDKCIFPDMRPGYFGNGHYQNLFSWHKKYYLYVGYHWRGYFAIQFITKEQACPAKAGGCISV